MRRNDITKKQIIKALSIGLSAAMVMQPMTVMADDSGVGYPTEGDPIEEGDTLTAADESVKSDNLEEIDTAINEAAEAIGAEVSTNEIAKEEIIAGRHISLEDAVFNESVAVIGLLEDNDIDVFTGYKGYRPVVSDINDSAAEFEREAAGHVERAKEILEEAEKELTGDVSSDDEEKKAGILDDFEEKIEAVDESLSTAARAAGDVSSNNMDAQDALEGALAATNSTEAGQYADEAGKAAEDASGNNAIVQAAADEAFSEYEEAKRLYEEAKEVADKANREADEAVRAGRGDAEKALYDAKLAEEKASNLMENLEKAKARVESLVAYDEKLLEKANTAVENLENILNGLNDEADEAKEEYQVAKSVQKAAQEALNEAWRAKQAAPSGWDIYGLECQYNKLSAAYNDACENLRIAKENLDSKEGSKAEAEAAFNAAKEVYDAIEVSLEKAKQDLEEAKANVTELTKEKDSLEKTYGKDFWNDLKSVVNGDEDAAKKVIALVGGVSEVEKFQFDGFNNGIFKGSDENGVKFFTYEIGEDGTVSVINVTKEVVDTVIKEVEASTKEGLTEDEKNALINGLTDGTFFIEKTEVTGEQTYKVEYTEKITEKRGKKHTDKLGETGTYTHDNGSKSKTYCVKYAGDLWWYTDDYTIVNGEYVPNENAEWEALDDKFYHKIVLTSTKTTTVEGVKEDELSLYSDKPGYKATEEEQKTDTRYKVTYGVLSREVTASELADAKFLWKEEISKDTYTVTVKGGEKAGDTHNCMRWNAPEYENGELKYDYAVTMGGITYSTGNGKLKWSPDEFAGGKWMYYYDWNNNWYWIPDSETVDAYTKDVTINDVSDPSPYMNNSKYTVTKSTEAKYLIYYKASASEDKYGYTIGTKTDFADLAGALSDATASADKASGIVSAIEAYNAANENLKTATDEYNKASKEYDDLFEQKGATEREKNDKLKELEVARKAWEDAQEAYNKASDALKKAKDDTRKAKGELDKINGIIYQYAYAKNVAVADRNSIQMALESANAEVENWNNKIARATELAEAAKEARVQAEEAKKAIDNIKASNLGAEALARAEAELKVAKEAYEEAAKLAEQALADAEAAKEAYEKAVNRVNELIAEENRRAEESRRNEEENEEVVPQTLIPEATPAIAAVNGVALVATAPATVEETVEEVEETKDVEVVIAEEEVAKADGLGAEELEITEEGTPLAIEALDEEKAGMNWWWIIVVLVLGTTGAELYRRHLVKEKEKKEEK